MALTPGTRLGVYEVTGQISTGRPPQIANDRARATARSLVAQLRSR